MQTCCIVLLGHKTACVNRPRVYALAELLLCIDQLLHICQQLTWLVVVRTTTLAGVVQVLVLWSQIAAQGSNVITQLIDNGFEIPVVVFCSHL